MIEKDPRDLTLVSLVKKLDHGNSGRFWKEMGRQIAQWVDQGKSKVDNDLQFSDHPELTEIVFEKYAPLIRETYQRITKLYQEFERRLKEYEANKKKEQP